MPRAEIKINPTIREYKTAWLLAERGVGVLRALPWAVLVSAALLFAGTCSLSWFRQNYSSVVLPLFLCFLCPALLAFFFFILPGIIKMRAAKDYTAYSALMNDARMQLYTDNVVTSARTLTLNDPYALMAGCIETPGLFVLIKDRERILIIPKRCLPPEKAGEISEFLRHTFARKRRVMRYWVF